MIRRLFLLSTSNSVLGIFLHHPKINIFTSRFLSWDGVQPWREKIFKNFAMVTEFGAKTYNLSLLNRGAFGIYKVVYGLYILI